MNAFWGMARRKLLALGALLAVGLSIVSACSGPDRAGFVGAHAGEGIFARDSGGPCTSGTSKSCGVTLEQGNGAMTCYRGTQFCENGAWSTCQAGEISREPLPFSGFDPASRRALGLPPISIPVECGNGVAGAGGSGTGGAATGGATGGAVSSDFANPCDPGCMYYGENPADLNASGGADPGPMPTPPPRTCVHGLCTVGAGLVSSCDPCVAAVCAAHPTCCNTASSTAWNTQCVDWATQICAGVTLPKTLCDFGLFSDNSIDLRNRASTNAAIGAYGNVALQADSTFTSIYATGDVDIKSLNNKNINMTDGVHAGGYIKFEASDLSQIYGNLYAGGAIDLFNVDIHGDVYSKASGTSITGMNTGSVTGQAYAAGTISTTPIIPNKNNGWTGSLPPMNLPPRTGMPATAIPDIPLTCPTGGPNRNLTGASPAPLTPGTHGNVDVDYDSVLELRGQGTYIFQSLKLRDRSVLRLDLNGAPFSSGFDIRVCDKSPIDGSPSQVFGGKVRVQGKAPLVNDSNGVLLDPKYLTLFYKGTTTLRFETDTYWTGIFMAPNARIEKSTMNGTPGAPLIAPPTEAQVNSGARAAPVNGAIWAKDLSLDVLALTKAIDVGTCKAVTLLAANLPGNTCPIVNGVTALQNEPCVTGQDCQANYSCEGPMTGATCTHDKCAIGAALSGGCDDCVARVCKAVPSCCTTTWDAACVNAVGTHCDAICRTGDCTQDPCAAGAQPIDKKCDDDLSNGAGCLDVVCATNPTCCQSGGAWSAACVSALQAACGSLIAGNSRYCDYSIFATDEYLNSGAPPTLNGGDAHEASEVDPDPTPPTVDFNCSPGSVDHGAGDGDFNADPAIHYNNVTVGAGSDFNFSAGGKYYFNDVHLDGSNTISLPPAPQVVEIYVCGRFFVGGESTFTGIVPGADSMRFRVYSNYDGSGAIWFYRSAGLFDTFGALYAPYGGIRLGDRAVHHGTAWGEDVSIGSPVTVNYPAAAEAACEAAPLDGGALCPLTLTPKPTTTGSCVANVPGYKDSACAGYDLAAGIPCDKKVPICNHGTTDFNSSLTVGFWTYAQAQLAVDEPLVPPSGTCTQNFASAPIKAGTCVDMNCAGLPTTPAQPYTIMVDPAKLTAECGGNNGHRLDNWTVYDGRVCVPYSQPRTLEYDYEAKCPSGSSARWGLLTWDSQTPGNSTVTFSAKVGADDDELTAASFTQIGQASRVPDTQTCVFQDATPCYADITGALGLDPENQGQFLQLQIVLTPSSGSPVLKDWGISYSCVYDE